MSARVACLCNICVCGRHKCPHNPQGVPRTNVPCIYSEYHDEYPPRPIGPRETFKPEHKPLASDQPLDSLTTHKTDYILHPLGTHYVHKANPYERPEGEIDHTTNYQQHFTPKNSEPVKPIRHAEQPRMSAKFGGMPTYKDDYKPWGLEPYRKYGPDNTYRPTDAKFDSSTNYKDDFIPHSVARQQMIIPPGNNNRSDGPFADETDYRTSYVKYELPKRTVKEKEQWQPNTTKLDDQTNYMSDYIPKNLSKTDSFKPANKPYESDARFEDSTTHKTDYIPREVSRRYQREREPYHPSEGILDSLTTHKQDFTPKEAARQQAIRPAESKKVSGKFDSSTQYNSDFLNFGNVERTQQKPREGYHPMDAKFEGQPTYSRDYIRYDGAEPTRSLRPMESGHRSDQPLDSDTEYGKEYQAKFLPPCPSDVLLSGRGHSGFTFKQQDQLGHRWYEVATQG